MSAGSTPKKGRIAAPGLASVSPGSTVIWMPPVSANNGGGGGGRRAESDGGGGAVGVSVTEK